MEVRLLKKSVIKTEEFYNDFLEGSIELKDEYFDGNESVYIDEAPNFPIYIAIKNVEERNKLFREAFDIISKYYNILDNTKQIAQKRANYKNYEEDLKKIDDFVFSFEIQKISYNDIKNSNLPINIISTIFLFIEEG